MKQLVAALLLLAAAGPARADWAELGAAAYCAADGTSFQLLPVVRTGDATYDVKAPAGAHEFPPGSDQHFECNLGEHQVRLSIRVHGPQERGMGQGAGVVIISGLVVDGTEQVLTEADFHWHVLGARALTRVEITRGPSGLMATLCQSDGWDWDRPYANERCQSQRIGR